MQRRDTLAALINLNGSLAEIGASLAALGWDAEPVIVLTRRDITAILLRFLSGELDASTVERWANLIECREDIAYESGHEEAIADAVYGLANPTLAGPLADIITNVLAALKQ